MVYSPPGSSAHGINQARVMEWVVIPFSRGSLLYLLHWKTDFFPLVPPGWRRWWHPTPVLLPGKSHWQRSLVGCSPWGPRVRHDWATSLSVFTFMHWRRKWQPTPVFLPWESQGQGAWWAAVYGVTQGQTRLKRLSSSSSSSRDRFNAR